ncbi:unnamed protein product [Acanthoscelides obtectus]|uniref:Uncharacterized protein n=1 Tax=Acanthoscelides obtectus TaxID=200917 RepID=A0A9P0KEF4_ACAOB|nr:unnamed protein product [Acanthoscelides obtectus]CAK1644685.1 hypothetical protein AOBTE_LOCUS13920 [Acanthoscelides obtectus]
MSKKVTEEKSPLLFVVDDNDDIHQAKQKMYFGNGRFRGITNGATAVFMQFPNYIGTCWVSTAICGLLFFMLMLLLFSAITPNVIRIPRCAPSDDMDNMTIHLVHIDHHPYEWTKSEINIIDKVVKNYPNYNVHLIMIEPQHRYRFERRKRGVPKSKQLVTVTTTSEASSTEKVKRTDQFGMRFDPAKFLDMLLRGTLIGNSASRRSKRAQSTATTPPSTSTTKTVSTVNDLLELYPNIMVENATYHQVFFQSPLYAYWPYLNDRLKVFAVRVMQLWQYGGLSFDLDPPTVADNTAKNTSDSDSLDKDFDIFHKHLLKFIISDADKGLKEDIVAADDEALHMESKIPCHAFFGEILISLRKAQHTSTVKNVIQSATKIFCTHYAFNKDYCKAILRTR